MAFPGKPPAPAAFHKDPRILETLDNRISFDTEHQQWLFHDETGDYQYNFIIERWIKIGKHIMNDEEIEEEANKQEIKQLKKQKLEEIKSHVNDFKTNKNTGVFISNLPPDSSEQELYEIFHKYGSIARDKTQDYRIKLYYDDQGVFKHEALVIFENESSVELSTTMLDGTMIKDCNIKVEPAKFKQQKDDAKAKIFSKTIVIANMFRQDEFNDELKSDIEHDIYDQCNAQKINDIIKISFFTKSKVITIKFKSIDSANKVIDKFNHRYYDGLVLTVSKYNGEKFEV